MTFSPYDSEHSDEPEAYSPMFEGTRLVSDGDHFYQVQPVPGSSPFQSEATSTRAMSLFDLDMDFVSMSPVSTVFIQPLPNLSTSASTAPAVSPTPSSVPPPSAERTKPIGPQPALSDTAARARIAAYILASGWFKSHEMEPCAGQPGVPDCALQLAKPEYSVWACLFKRVRRRGSTILKCVECGHETPRLNRAVGHQRAKWEHKPFACSDPGCDFRGSTSGSVADHRSPRTGMTPCSACGEAIVIKNMPRHLLQVHRR